MDVLDELREEGRAEGERIGERRGEKKGRAEGRAKALLKLLTARFGPVPASARARILAGTAAEHDRRLLRVLTARSLPAVLDPPAPRAKRQAPARKAARA